MAKRKKVSSLEYLPELWISLPEYHLKKLGFYILKNQWKSWNFLNQAEEIALRRVIIWKWPSIF